MNFDPDAHIPFAACAVVCIVGATLLGFSAPGADNRGLGAILMFVGLVLACVTWLRYRR